MGENQPGEQSPNLSAQEGDPSSIGRLHALAVQACCPLPELANFMMQPVWPFGELSERSKKRLTATAASLLSLTISELEARKALTTVSDDAGQRHIHIDAERCRETPLTVARQLMSHALLAEDVILHHVWAKLLSIATDPSVPIERVILLANVVAHIQPIDIGVLRTVQKHATNRSFEFIYKALAHDAEKAWGRHYDLVDCRLAIEKLIDLKLLVEMPDDHVAEVRGEFGRAETFNEYATLLKISELGSIFVKMLAGDEVVLGSRS